MPRQKQTSITVDERVTSLLDQVIRVHERKVGVRLSRPQAITLLSTSFLREADEQVEIDVGENKPSQERSRSSK